jgi:glycosyltransferase involved in cell wall biosynthesis
MAKKTKVLHVIHDLRCGGVEKLFLLIIDGLQKRGVVENVGCVMADKLDFLSSGDAKIITLGLPIRDSILSIALMSPYELFVLMRTIMREDPDIIFAHNTSAEQLLASIAGRILGKKVVVLKYEQRDTHHFGRRFIDPVNYSLCNKIVVISDATEDEVVSMGVPRSKISHIRNGKQKKQHMLSQKEARDRLGLAQNGLILGMVDRMHPVKNHAGMIRAMKDVLAIQDDAKLVIVGDDPVVSYKKSLEELVQKNGLEMNVIFLGERKDVEDIYPAFDIFVHPSFSEGGCPLAVLEAACAGLPMVLGKVGGVKDLPEGCALMIQPKDDKALAEALKKLIKDPELRKEYGRKAKAVVRNELSSDRMLEGYENLFKRLSEG